MCLQSAETVSEGGLDRGRRPRLKDGVGQPRVARAVRGVEVGRAAQEGEVQRVAHVGVGHREGRVLRQALHGGQVAGHMRARLRAHTCCIAPRTDVRSPQGQRSLRVGLKSASARPAGLLAYHNYALCLLHRSPFSQFLDVQCQHHRCPCNETPRSQAERASSSSNQHHACHLVQDMAFHAVLQHNCHEQPCSAPGGRST